MNIQRILAVLVIFVAATGAWGVLGWTTAERSLGSSQRLKQAVESSWGVPLAQQAPSFSVQTAEDNQPLWLMPASNTIEVELQTDYRKRGLIWYPTYIAVFHGAYTVTNTEQTSQQVHLKFDFPSKDGTYDAFLAEVNDRKLLDVNLIEGVQETVDLAPGESMLFTVGYRTRGIREWRYLPDPQVGRVQNLELKMTTNFDRVDYPEGALSPMSVQEAENGKHIVWLASDLITQEHIGMLIPEKLNPGPLTSRITFFAPVCLLFFFVLVATIDILYGVRVHPMHYMFVAAGFFAFHLLLAYLVGVVQVHAAFALAAAVSVFLVTSYLSAALRGRLPWKVAIGGQLFFLVLFSYSFFLEGITGLTVAIGSVVTLAILMRVTAHVDWEQVFSSSKRSTPPPLQPARPIQTQP